MIGLYAGWERSAGTNYAAFALVALHGVAYQWMETRVPLFVVGVGFVVLVVVALQVAGFWRVRAAGGG